MNTELNNKVYIVTGGSRGFGLAIAKTLVARGARVGLLSRNQAGLDLAVSEIGSDHALGVAVDVGSPPLEPHEYESALGVAEQTLNVLAERRNEDFAEERSQMGVRGDGVYRAVDNPSNVTAYHSFDSIEAAKGFASSPRLREVMEGAGVVSAPDIWFVEEA